MSRPETNYLVERFYGSYTSASRDALPNAATEAVDRLNNWIVEREMSGDLAEIVSVQSHLIEHGDYATCVLIVTAKMNAVSEAESEQP